MNKPFEDAVIQAVLENILDDIAHGSTKYISVPIYNQSDGTTTWQTREVNASQVIVSRVVEQISKNQKWQDKLAQKLESMLESKEFEEKVINKVGDNLIQWLTKEDNSWYDRNNFPNRESFKKSVRQKTIDYVAQREAERLMEAKDGEK